MAQESFEQLLNAVKQAESRGQRYDEKGKLLTSPKGAQGEMQVMPKTQLDPGYGVVPAKGATPDEIARVGRDYLKAMVDKYGDTQKALIAYNWGPGNTDKWLAKGADPKVLPAETQKYVSDITGMLGGKKTRVAEASDVQDLAKNAGPGYKAALAMMFLADDKPKTDEEDIWEEAQAPVEEETAQPDAFAGLDLGYKSPFPTQEPSAAQQLAQFARGGAVHRADGSPETGELTQAEIEAASRPAFVTPKSGLNRQQGPISQALNSGEAYPAIARGVAETPYNVVGAPVDIATLAMRPFGYKEEKPVMGSEWIKEKMTKYGIRPGEEANPTLQGFRTAGELGASVVNPGPVAAKVGQVAEKGVAAAGKEVARQVLRGMEGEGMLAPVSPPIAYAVKPKGGTFATSGSLKDEPISRMDELLQEYSEAMKNKIPDEHHAAVDTFIDKKLRKYFTQEYGTGSDPLRTAMREGNLPLYGKDVEQFPEYMIAAARDPNAPGHLQAKRHLEKAYDENTALRLEGLSLHNPSDADARRRADAAISAFKQKQREQMTAEGLPDEFQNPPSTQFFSVPELEKYPSIGKMLSNVVAAGERGTLPSGQVWALQNQQPLYDIGRPGMEYMSPRTVAETLASLKPEKLKNMSFDQAMIEGTKNMRVFREYDTAVERAAKGLSVPKEVVSMFTKPVTKTDSGEWVKLTDKAATKLEGKLMHHSVGGYADNPHYNLGGPGAFDSGLAQIFSLRSGKTGLPEVTIEAEKTKDGIKINQIKGDYNSFPSHRAEDVFKFLDKHPEIQDIKSEYYPKSNTGEDLQQKIGVDWKGSYEHWKQGLPGEWRVTRQNDNRIDYIYALPEGKAAGGMIERNKGDNRRYL